MLFLSYLINSRKAIGCMQNMLIKEKKSFTNLKKLCKQEHRSLPLRFDSSGKKMRSGQIRILVRIDYYSIILETNRCKKTSFFVFTKFLRINL